MEKQIEPITFQQINHAYNSVFQPGKMSIGLVVPIEHYDRHPVPTMERHIERVQLAEALGFSSIWIRDVPFNVPAFGDAGQTYDPFVYLGLLTGATKEIALGVASIILPLRHPAHVAKAAASVDHLSGGRLLLGVASGDRPSEYPALNTSFAERGRGFRESFAYIRQMSEAFPTFENEYGSIDGQMDMLPKPTSGRLPLLVTGNSRQSPDWIAQNSDGWMIYPQNAAVQGQIIRDWQSRISAAGRYAQPVMQPLHIDLENDPDAKPQPIHLGFRSGLNSLLGYLHALEEAGINHVAINLRFNRADVEETMKRLADEVLPEFE